MTLSARERDAIRERLGKATQGPWRITRDGIRPWTGALIIENDVGEIAHTTRGWEGDGREGDSSGQANAAFIAHAPTDIAALLRDLEEKERECEMAMADLVKTKHITPALDKSYAEGWNRACDFIEAIIRARSDAGET